MPDGSMEPNENDFHTERASVFTFFTGSTVWGPGALSGKLLKAVGEIGLDAIVDAVIRTRLSGIKRTWKKRPAVFLELRLQDIEESQRILRDLDELCLDYYSESVRATATMLLAEIQVYQEVPVVRRSLAKKHRIFTDPRNEEEKQLANETFEALRELVDERPDYLGIAARRLVTSIASLYLDRETVEAIRWKTLSRDIQDFESINITEDILGGSLWGYKKGDEDDSETYGGIMVTIETTIAIMDDIKVGQLSGLRDPDVRVRSIIIEKNMMAQYLESSISL